jgi:RNA-directed DNA polymerase
MTLRTCSACSFTETARCYFLLEGRRKGVLQGGPLSPLLANIMLDRLDKELEKREHRFARYADDFTILVKSQCAGRRVLRNI